MSWMMREIRKGFSFPSRRIQGLRRGIMAKVKRDIRRSRGMEIHRTGKVDMTGGDIREFVILGSY